MQKTPDVMEDMLDYVHRLRRHTIGRRAFHVKLSSLERHMREPYYRRELASALRSLVQNKGARLFALPNADCVGITAEATLTDLTASMRDVYKRLNDSDLLRSLDPVIGVNDWFIEWFDLEQDYADFATYTQHLAGQLKG